MPSPFITHLLAFLAGVFVDISRIDEDFPVPPVPGTIISATKTIRVPADTIVPSIDDGLSHGAHVGNRLPVFLFLLIVLASFLLSIAYVHYLTVEAAAQTSTPEQRKAHIELIAKRVLSERCRRKTQRKLTAVLSETANLRNQLEARTLEVAGLRNLLEAYDLEMESLRVQHYLGLTAMKELLLYRLTVCGTDDGAALENTNDIGAECLESVPRGSAPDSTPPSPLPTVDETAVEHLLGSAVTSDRLPEYNSSFTVNRVEMAQAHPEINLNADEALGSTFRGSMARLQGKSEDGDESLESGEDDDDNDEENSQIVESGKKKRRRRKRGKKKSAEEKQKKAAEEVEKRVAQELRRYSVEADENVDQASLARGEAAIERARTTHGSAPPPNAPIAPRANNTTALGNAPRSPASMGLNASMHAPRR